MRPGVGPLIIVSIFQVVLEAGGQAAEPPPRPPLDAETAAQLQADDPTRCDQAHAVREGDAAPCRGVLVPVVELAQLQLDAEHLGLVEDLYRVDTAILETEGAELRAQVEQLQAPPTFWERPGWPLVVGFTLGAGAAIGMAHALP